MLKKCLAGTAIAGLLSWAALTWAATLPDAKSLIGDASKAMGTDNLKTIEYSGSGADFSLGQAVNPSSPWPRFNDKSYTRLVDFEAPASRMERVRTQGENPPRGGGGQPLVGEQKAPPQIITANSPWQQQLDIWMLPPGFLRAAAMNNATVKSAKVNGKKYMVVSFMGQNKAMVNGYINDQNMVDRVETWLDNPVLGDMLFEADYSDYKDFNGIKFPTHILQKQGGYPVFELTITDVKTNVPAEIQAPPARGGGPGGPAGPATSQKLGDGVYLILGGYAAVAVDMKDYIVVIEGPQSEQRAQAIIDETKKLIPNKPIKYVVNTHHHFDHASGLRTFVAEGATVVTHQINKPYFEKVWANPHTLSPDRLSQSKVKPKFETMTEKKVMTDGNQVIELYRVQGSTHNDGMIMAYLPRVKVLVEADEFNPPANPNAPPPNPPNPYNVNLVENIDRLKLDVDRIIPIHYPADARVVGKSELLKAAGKTT